MVKASLLLELRQSVVQILGPRLQPTDLPLDPLQALLDVPAAPHSEEEEADAPDDSHRYRREDDEVQEDQDDLRAAGDL